MACFIFVIWGVLIAGNALYLYILLMASIVAQDSFRYFFAIFKWYWVNTITYRLYDWYRVDSEGNERELHNDIALEAFDFDMPDNFRVNYTKDSDSPTELVSCLYCTTKVIKVHDTILKENTNDSYKINMVDVGKAKIEGEVS